MNLGLPFFRYCKSGKSLLSSFFWLVFILLAINSAAQDKTYITTGSVIYEVNLETCQASEVLTIGAAFFDIAYSPVTDKLYGVLAYFNETYFTEIDLANRTFFSVLRIPEANSLTCNSRGVFYSSFAGIINEINLDSKKITALPGAVGFSDGDLTISQNQLYLSTMNRNLEVISIDSKGAHVQQTYSMDNLDTLWGVFTRFKDCKEEFYITSRNDIYKLDESFKPHMQCSDIVESTIFGAASTTETFDYLNVNLDDPMALCDNAIPLEIDVEIPFATFLWSNGTANSKNLIYSEGTYWVDVTLGDCTKRDSVEVFLQNMPIVDLGEDLVLCEGTKHVIGVPIEDVAFKWQDGSWKSSYTVTKSGTYEVEITKNGCKDSDQVNIEFEYCEPILEMPNVVTPNQDGSNEKLVPFKTENIVSMHTSIYNRLGKKVFETDNPLIEWSPYDLPPGLYYYLVNLTELTGLQLNKKGWVQVLK